MRWVRSRAAKANLLATSLGVKLFCQLGLRLNILAAVRSLISSARPCCTLFSMMVGTRLPSRSLMSCSTLGLPAPITFAPVNETNGTSGQFLPGSRTR